MKNWICENCETLNTDELACNVCGNSKPGFSIDIVDSPKLISLTKEPPKRKKKKSILLILLFISLISSILYTVSCKYLGYCLKTPITETEIEEFLRNSEANGSNFETNGTDKELITWYADYDGDGLRDPNETKESITQPSGFISKLNPIDNCPSTRGPKCTGGCPDLNGNCVPDKDEIETPTIAPLWDCQDLRLNKGDLCDDNNPDTENDIVTFDCNCVGQNVWDCPSWNRDIGDSCNDRNSQTENDVITAKCECRGKTKTIKIDSDDDTLVDEKDKCPHRTGPISNEGCPNVSIDHGEIFKDQLTVIKLNFKSKSSDKYKWSSNSEVLINGENIRECAITPKRYGLISFSLEIKNDQDDYYYQNTWTEISRISKNDLEDKIRENLIVIGQYDPGNHIPTTLRNKSEKTRSLLVNLFDRDVKITEKGRAFGNNIGAFIDAKMLTKGSYVNDVRINNISYNDEGLIDNFDLELIKLQ